MAKTERQKNDYAEYLRTGLQIRYLSQKYRKAHEWIPRLASEAPGLRPEDALKKVRERLTELRRARKRLTELSHSERTKRARQELDLRQSAAVRAMPHRERCYVCSAGSPGSVQLSYPRPFEPEDLYPKIIQRPNLWTGQDYRVRVDGIARASGFREYVWAAPDERDTYERHLFLPYGADTDPNNFVGATGLQFLSEIEVQPDLFVDDIDSCGFGGVLQYCLPEVPWDGALQWRVCQQFEIPEITSSADYGYFTLASTTRQCPSWEDFPASSDAFVESFGLAQLLPIIWAAGEDFSVGPFNVTDTFQNDCNIFKGQKPCIYVGFSILIMARDGSTSLGDPNMAYHYWPGAGSGLSYTYFRI